MKQALTFVLSAQYLLYLHQEIIGTIEGGWSWRLVLDFCFCLQWCFGEFTLNYICLDPLGRKSLSRLSFGDS